MENEFSVFVFSQFVCFVQFLVSLVYSVSAFPLRQLVPFFFSLCGSFTRKQGIEKVEK